MAGEMRPRFREDKAIAAAAELIMLSEGQCDKYWLNKIMYYIERISLVDSGQPVFFDTLFSVKFGPIVSAINDGIDASAYPYDSPWSKYFHLSGNSVSLKESPDTSILSPYEEELISAAFEKFKGQNFSQLRNYFHKLPEFQNTETREEIHYRDIFSTEGLSEHEIQETVNEISYLASIEKIGMSSH